MAAVEKGGNLSEVLTHLVAEVAKQVDRAAMFIVKGNAAVGWYARGFDHGDAVKAVTIPLTADTLFRLVHGTRHASRAHVSHSPATAQALARLGGDPQGLLAVPSSCATRSRPSSTATARRKRCLRPPRTSSRSSSRSRAR